MLAPDMFWRIEPRFERKDESGMADVFAMVQKFDFSTAVDDIQATHTHLLGMPECSGKIGAVGFCLGGGLAFAAATLSRVKRRGPDVAVCYYGSPVNDLLGHVGTLDCPAMFHYGDDDPFIPADKITAVEQAVADRADVEFHRYDAGHGSATGTRRPCTTRQPRWRPGRGPSTSSRGPSPKGQTSSPGGPRPCSRITHVSSTGDGSSPGSWRMTWVDPERWRGYFSIPPETDMSSPVTNDDASLAR